MFYFILLFSVFFNEFFIICKLTKSAYFFDQQQVCRWFFSSSPFSHKFCTIAFICWTNQPFQPEYFSMKIKQTKINVKIWRKKLKMCFSSNGNSRRKFPFRKTSILVEEREREKGKLVISVIMNQLTHVIYKINNLKFNFSPCWIPQKSTHTQNYAFLLCVCVYFSNWLLIQIKTNKQIIFFFN